MELLVVLGTLFTISLAAPFLGAETRRPEAIRVRGPVIGR
jgi:hypothetical protein